MDAVLARSRFSVGDYHQLAKAGSLDEGDRVELIDGEIVPMSPVGVLCPHADFYSTAHPLPADVLLLIEVADRSLLANRRVKPPRDERAGIPEGWLVSLEAGAIERYSPPYRNGYCEVVVDARSQRIASTMEPDLRLPSDQVLGPV